MDKSSDEKICTHTNINEIKKYVEHEYKNVSDDFDKLDSRLIGVIGFSGVLIKFSDELYSCGTLPTILKLLAIILFMASLICGLRGVFPRKTYVENPRTFRLDKEYYETDDSDPERCIRTISDSIMIASEQIRDATKAKANCLAGAIWCLSIGIGLMGFNLVIETLAKYPYT